MRKYKGTEKQTRSAGPQHLSSAGRSVSKLSVYVPQSPTRRQPAVPEEHGLEEVEGRQVDTG